MTNKILRLPDVTARTGLSRTAIYDLIGQGVFPRQRRLAPRTVGWLDTEIDDWIAGRPEMSGRKDGGHRE